MNFTLNNKVLLMVIFLLFLVKIFLFIFSIFKENQFLKHPLAKSNNLILNNKQYLIKRIILFLCFLLLSFSVLRPSWGEKITHTERKGNDIVFSLDVSKSMDALDMETGSRLNFSKQLIQKIVNNYPQNRFSLIVFAGESFVSVPLTFDHAAFLSFLEGIDSSVIATQGTNLSTSLLSATQRLQAVEEKGRGKAIILISDGEEFSGQYQKIAQQIKQKNIEILTIGIGSENGAPIIEGRDPFGQIIYKTYQGKKVISHLNEKPLQEIATISGGQYFRLKNKKDLTAIFKNLEKLQKTTLRSLEKKGKEDQYQIFLSLSFLCFLIFIFMPFFNDNFKKNKSLNFKFFKINLLLFSLFFSGCYVNNYKAIQEAQNKNLTIAEKLFLKNLTQKKNNYIDLYNLGTLYLQNKKLSKTEKHLLSAMKKKCSKKDLFCRDLFYNLASFYYRLGQKDDHQKIPFFEKAITFFEKALQIDPHDQQAKENIAFIQKKIKEEKNKQNSQNNKNNQKQNLNSSQENKQSDSLNQSKEIENSNENNNKEKQKSSMSENNEKTLKDNKMQKNSISNQEEQNNKKENENNTFSKEEQNNNSANKQENNEKQNLNSSENELNQQMQKEIENYLQQMQKQEKSLQRFFQQNPSKEENNDFNPFKNDPFFKDFFSESFLENSPTKKDPLEKDW